MCKTPFDSWKTGMDAKTGCGATFKIMVLKPGTTDVHDHDLTSPTSAIAVPGKETFKTNEPKLNKAPRIWAKGSLNSMKWEITEPKSGAPKSFPFPPPLPGNKIKTGPPMLIGYQTEVKNSAHPDGSIQEHCVMFVERGRFPGLECRHIMVQTRQDDNAAGGPTGGMCRCNSGVTVYEWVRPKSKEEFKEPRILK